MTIIPKNDYGDDMIPKYRYRPSECPRCKAKTLDEASKVCRPVQGHDGDYQCPGDGESLNPFGLQWTKSGKACQLTNKSAKAEGKYLDELYGNPELD